MSRAGNVKGVNGSRSERAPLYNDERVTITPSWLSIEQTRYAIRTVVRLDSQEAKPQVDVPYLFFFGSIALMAYSLYQFTNDLPTLIPWIMLLASLGICLVSGWLAFSAKSRYRILVTLFDGHKVEIETTTKAVATNMLGALTEAMDWHRNEDIVIDAERESHVRRRLASATGGSDESLSDVSKKRSGEQRRHVQRLIPLLTAMLKDRQ